MQRRAANRLDTSYTYVYNAAREPRVDIALPRRLAIAQSPVGTDTQFPVEPETSVVGRGKDTSRPASLWRAVPLLLVLAFLIGLGTHAWRSGVTAEGLAALGYPGIFVLMALSGAGSFIPLPVQAAIFAAGAVWSPLLVGISAGLGSTTGKLAVYSAGRAGNMVLENRVPPSWLSAVRRWLARYGFFAILIVAAIPNPIFDALVLTA